MGRDFAQETSTGTNDWTVWKVIGRIDTKTADDAYKYGADIVNKSNKTVLDMSQMDYISSAGIRVLLRLNKLAVKSGKRFTVAGSTGMVTSVLQDSGMDELLNMKASVEELD